MLLLQSQYLLELQVGVLGSVLLAAQQLLLPTGLRADVREVYSLDVCVIQGRADQVVLALSVLMDWFGGLHVSLSSLVALVILALGYEVLIGDLTTLWHRSFGAMRSIH